MNFILRIWGPTAGALLLSGAAMAADLPKGKYEIDGFITSSNCVAALAKGAAVDNWINYPGAGATGLILASPSTSATGGAGDASTSTCKATTAVPAGGLNGASLTLNCYADTDSGAGTTIKSKFKPATFKVGASHSSSVWQVSMTGTVVVGTTTACSFTSDTTWTLQ